MVFDGFIVSDGKGKYYGQHKDAWFNNPIEAPHYHTAEQAAIRQEFIPDAAIYPFTLVVAEEPVVKPTANGYFTVRTFDKKKGAAGSLQVGDIVIIHTDTLSAQEVYLIDRFSTFHVVGKCVYGGIESPVNYTTMYSLIANCNEDEEHFITFDKKFFDEHLFLRLRRVSKDDTTEPEDILLPGDFSSGSSMWIPRKVVDNKYPYATFEVKVYFVTAKAFACYFADTKMPLFIPLDNIGNSAFLTRAECDNFCSIMNGTQEV